MRPHVLFFGLLLGMMIPLVGQAQRLFTSDPAKTLGSTSNPSAPGLRLHPFSKDYLKSFAQDGWGMLQSPASWNGRSWSQLALGGALVAAAWYVDPELRQFTNRTDGWAGAAAYTDVLGNGLLTIPVAGVIWLEGRYRQNQHTQLVGLNVAKAFILSRVMVQVPKYLFQRHRPLDAANNPLLFDGPFGRFVHTSFPSGHTTSAFAAAAVFRQAYRDEHRWVPITFYSFAAVAAAGRMLQGEHWFSDVVAGALIGQVVGDYISKKGITRFEVAGNGLFFRF